MEKITIDEQEYPVHFGYAALLKFEREFKKSITKLDFNNIGVLESMQIVWCGFADGHRMAKKKGDLPKSTKFEMSIDDIADLVDTDNNLLTRLMEMFSTALAPEEKVTEETEETEGN